MSQASRLQIPVETQGTFSRGSSPTGSKRSNIDGSYGAYSQTDSPLPKSPKSRRGSDVHSNEFPWTFDNTGLTDFLGPTNLGQQSLTAPIAYSGSSVIDDLFPELKPGPDVAGNTTGDSSTGTFVPGYNSPYWKPVTSGQSQSTLSREMPQRKPTDKTPFVRDPDTGKLTVTEENMDRLEAILFDLADRYQTEKHLRVETERELERSRQDNASLSARLAQINAIVFPAEDTNAAEA